MIAVDTNVLVRYLVDDKTASAQVLLAKNAVNKAKQIFVSQLVQAEIVWVLQSAYKFNKKEILYILNGMYEHGAILLQYEKRFFNALRQFTNSNVDFSDCLILEESKQAECRLITFDKKLGKLDNTKLLAR